MFDYLSLLVEEGLPANLLPRSRSWFVSNMKRLEKLHGDKWDGNREWLASYLNAEVKELANATCLNLKP